ncbi:MAG: hypothetical protein BWK80_32340 [Desulfobacteraceae bacterium IS3]|nr:MAG: hypothetical protein BWK80_32340 [Desulfobacteraceae bacterium IS3]
MTGAFPNIFEIYNAFRGIFYVYGLEKGIYTLTAAAPEYADATITVYVDVKTERRDIFIQSEPS